MTFEEGAAVCDGAILALMGMRPADIRKGQRILVYGASGSIGTAGVQLGKYFGADVTAVCNTRNLELVRSLGADRVIDYTQEDFTKNGWQYDYIFDAVGKLSFSRCRRSLEPGGIYNPNRRAPERLLGAANLANRRQERDLPGTPRYTKEGRPLPQGADRGREIPGCHRPCYPLEDVVEATRYVETMPKTGNVVLTVSRA